MNATTQDGFQPHGDIPTDAGPVSVNSYRYPHAGYVELYLNRFAEAVIVEVEKAELLRDALSAAIAAAGGCVPQVRQCTPRRRTSRRIVRH